MSVDDLLKKLLGAFQKTPYAHWLKQEGLPVVEGYALEDVREIELGPWPRLGGRGAYVILYGMMEGFKGMYVCEIPPGKALEAERHLYEEVICILDGHGATEIWQEGSPKQMFEWGPWSLFSPPLNSWHRLVNGGREPVRFLAVTNAPFVMALYRNTDFVFSCPYGFSDRYAGEEDFFAVGKKRYRTGLQNLWETNFIPDIKAAAVEEQERKGSGVKITQFEMSGNTLIGHLSEWPAGRYHKAHFHGPGALLLGLQSKGYVLMWAKELGTEPYKNEYGSQVIEARWREGSVYSPLDRWFHQHFNTGPTTARHLAIRYGSRLHPDLGVFARAREPQDTVYIDVREGGSLIEYEAEDPEIRRRYEAALKDAGVRCQMPPVTYR